MTAPTIADLGAAVARTNDAIAGIEDEYHRDYLRQAFEFERMAVLAGMADYETVLRAAGQPGSDHRFPGRPAMLTPPERIRSAIQVTNTALDALDGEDGASSAVWHERAVVSLACGVYSAEMLGQWKMKRAAPSAVLADDGQVHLLSAESPLVEALRRFGDEGDGEG